MVFRLINNEYKFRLQFQCKNDLWEKVIDEQIKLRLKTRNDVIEKILLEHYKKLENEEKEK